MMIDTKDYKRAFKQYEEEYQLTTPPPERKDYKAHYPAQFWIFLPVALLGPVVSGLRTATVFERSSGAAGLANWAPLAVAIMGTFVVELGVVGFQVERIRRMTEGKRKLPPASNYWVMLGLVCAFGMALVANLDIVFLEALAKTEVQIPSWIEPTVVGFFLGAGVPLLALVAGEIIGRMIVEVQAENRRLGVKYGKDFQAWQVSLKASWDRVKRRRLAAIGQPVAASGKRAKKKAASEQPVEAVSNKGVEVEAATDLPLATANGKGIKVEADSDKRVEMAATTNLPVEATNNKGVEMEAASDQTSEAMASHLKAIRKMLEDRRQLGTGNGTFTRADVEKWQEVSTSQASNILQYGQQHQVLELVSRARTGYTYRFIQ